MPNVVKNKVHDFLTEMQENLLPPVARNGDNREAVFREAFVWQEVLAVAADKYKKAMKALETEGIIPDDDRLRDYEIGDHTIESTRKFAFCIKLASPRKNFSLEEFVAKVARKFRIPSSKLLVIAENAKIEGNAALSKRIIEL